MSEIDVLEEKSTKLSIPKLEEHNYPSWSSRMRAYLRSNDLWKICSGETAVPSKKKKAEAANIIISHLGDTDFDAVVTIDNEDKPALLWEAIVDRYASESVNNKARIWLRFMRYKYNGNLKTYLFKNSQLYNLEFRTTLSQSRF